MSISLDTTLLQLNTYKLVVTFPIKILKQEYDQYIKYDALLQIELSNLFPPLVLFFFIEFVSYFIVYILL